MELTKFLPIEAIKIGIVVKNKKEALNRMVDLAAKSGSIKNIEIVKNEVYEREMLASTGIGNGVALPHCKSQAITSMSASFAVLKTPINFDSIDDKQVQVMMLLLSNEIDVGKQLRCISAFSKVFSQNSTIENILNMKNENDILLLLSELLDNKD
jgi:mannitol/fructose-specific phosphotransferase system IIA component (Ntr-type)